MTTDNFSKRLREEMARRKWTQTELAKQSGVPQTTISALYRGTSEPTLSTAAKIAAALGLTLDELACNDDSEPLAAAC